MASKSATTLASSPPKPSTVAPTSVWSLLGEQGFETTAFSSFFEPSVAEGKESIELPKGCGAHRFMALRRTSSARLCKLTASCCRLS
ncbi:hypothetical protein RI054_16g77290 [Pseudoscourfieldia marina]